MPTLRLLRRPFAQVRQTPTPGSTPGSAPGNISVLIAAMLLLVAALLLLANPAAAQPKLQTYQSRSYRIHTNLTREEAVDFGAHMDLIFAEYSRMLRSLRGKARGKQDMYLLRTNDDYQVTLKTFDIDGTNSGGMFFYGPNGKGLATFVEGRDRGEVFSTLQHEGFHQFAFIKARGKMPIWVNEGLAEYFGEAIIVAGKVKHGLVNAQRLERVRGEVEAGRAIPFREIIAIESPQWRTNLKSGSPKGSLQYDQAWSIVHFLIHADERFAKAFSKYLQLISEGRHPPKAFADIFGSDLAPFEKRYRAFLAELEPDPYGAALTRMRFLAAGLGYLETLDQPMPQDLDALRDALRQQQFALSYRSHGNTKTTYSADDAAMFTYADADNKPQPFVIEPVADKAGGERTDAPDKPAKTGKSAETGAPQSPSLPEVFAPQLTPPARLVWVRYTDGTLQTEIKFGR